MNKVKRVYPPSTDMYEVFVQPQNHVMKLHCLICGEIIPVGIEPTLNQLEAAVYDHIDKATTND